MVRVARGNTCMILCLKFTHLSNPVEDSDNVQVGKERTDIQAWIV